MSRAECQKRWREKNRKLYAIMQHCYAKNNRDRIWSMNRKYNAIHKQEKHDYNSFYYKTHPFEMFLHDIKRHFQNPIYQFKKEIE